MGGGTPQRWSARIVAVFALAAGALALGTGASHACSCIRPSVVDEARSADAVFVGTVSNGAATGVSNSVEMTVTGVYKGRVGQKAWSSVVPSRCAALTCGAAGSMSSSRSETA